jgi:hypothetical protein
MNNFFSRHPDKPVFEQFAGKPRKVYILKTGKGGNVAFHIVMVHCNIVSGEGLFLDIPLVLGIFAFGSPEVEEVLNVGGLGCIDGLGQA